MTVNPVSLSKLQLNSLLYTAKQAFYMQCSATFDIIMLSFFVPVGIAIACIAVSHDRQHNHIERHQHHKLYQYGYVASNRYIPDNIRRQVLERDGYQCVVCSSPIYLEIDHIIPISRGGGSQPNNLQILCRSCNARKGAS